MLCPRCKVEMIEKDYRGLKIDRCQQCKGVWLDKGELDEVLLKKMGNIIDAGSISQAPAAPKTDVAFCRRCNNNPMVPMRGAGNVEFDWCDKCEGMWFDRGELTVLHYVKDE